MLKCLCKNKRELKDIIFKGFFLQKVEKKQKPTTKWKEKDFWIILLQSHSEAIHKLHSTSACLQNTSSSSYFLKKAYKNYLSAHSRDTNTQFSDGCLEETSERDKWINTSTSNASLCIIQPLKPCPSLPFPDSVTRGWFRWPARKLAHSDRKPLDLS